MRQRLTSETDPLRIDALAVPGAPGLIGMTLCPGKKDPYAAFGAWDRDLRRDLQTIGDWGASAIVTLIEEHEFALLGVPDFAKAVGAAFHWHWLPIADGGVPDAGFERQWQAAGPQLRRRLTVGERVLIHCRAGLGRTGLVAARLLVEFGSAPAEAVRAVRQARRSTIETSIQEQYILGLGQGFARRGTDHDA